MRLLVTRPDPDSQRTGAVLRERGHEVIVAPLLRVERVAFTLPDCRMGAVVMTSANAARVIAEDPSHAGLTALPAFTVGRHTAHAAHAAGFTEIHSADGDKKSLSEFIVAHYQQARGPLLYLAAEDRAGDLGANLASHGFTVVTAVVYRAAKLERFPPSIEPLLACGAVDGVLHFSKRSSEAYLTCATRGGILAHAIKPLHYCLSQQVAAPLAAAGAATRVASRPEEAALIDLVAPLEVS